MNNPITVKEMVNHLIRLHRREGWTEKCPTCEAIRKILEEIGSIKEFVEIPTGEMSAVSYIKWKRKIERRFWNLITDTDESRDKPTELNIEVSDKEGA